MVADLGCKADRDTCGIYVCSRCPLQTYGGCVYVLSLGVKCVTAQK